MKYLSHGLDATDDFPQFLGDSRLTGLVVIQRQGVDHFRCILGRVLHCGHTCAVLARNRFQDGTEELRAKMPRDYRIENPVFRRLEERATETIFLAEAKNATDAVRNIR